MPVLIENSLNSILISIYKNLTVLLFFILPTKVSNIFVSLSILSLIYDIKKIDFKDHPLSEDKFRQLLHVSFNEDIMLLPKYTVSWFWNDRMLQDILVINGKTYTLKEALLKDDILFSHLRYITDKLLCHIHPVFKFKLRLKQIHNRLIVKHNVMNLLIRAA